MPHAEEDLSQLSNEVLVERRKDIIEYLADTAGKGCDKTIPRAELRAIEAELRSRGRL